MDQKWKSLPKKLIERLIIVIPPKKFGQVTGAMCGKHPTTFRANTLKITPDELQEKLEHLGLKIRRANWNRNAFIYESSKRDLVDLPLYNEGYFYIQSLSSMIPAILLNPKAGEKVLDITAAPGSKTTQMAAMVDNSGVILANDISKVRLFKLQANMRIQGVTNVKIENKDARSLWLSYQEYFDKTLVDVPCSMEGKFNSYEPKTYKGWSEKNINLSSKRAKWILRSAISATKAGGRIVYSTCTLAPEENEEAIDWIMEKEKGSLEVEMAKIPGLETSPSLLSWKGKSYNRQIEKTFRILPSHLMEGFYVAVLRKTKSTIWKKS